MAQVLNAEYGRTILPIGELTQVKANVAPLKVEAEPATLRSVNA